MFLFETVPRIVCLISCTPFHDPGTCEMDRILFHGDPEKCEKNAKSTAREKRRAYQPMKARCFQIKMMKLLKEQEDMNMTENMMDIGDIEFGAELTLDEMNEISGGAFRKPAAKAGYTIYQIKAHDTLIRIANKFGIKSYREILKWNPKITNPRLIRTGDYLYIKK